MERISITVPDSLLKEFDRVLKDRGYASRSEGLRDAIRNYIIEQTMVSNLSGELAGTITLIYNHEESKVMDRLTDLQHDFSKVIESSLHVHLDDNHCLEVIVVRGAAGRIKTLLNRVCSTKGVKSAKLTTGGSSKVVM